MKIYQVVNEQNYPLYASYDLDNAIEEAEMLNEVREDHYFYVSEVDIEEA